MGGESRRGWITVFGNNKKKAKLTRQSKKRLCLMITGIKSCKKRFAGFKAKGGGQTFAMPTFCPVNYSHMLKCPPQPTEFH